MWGKFPSEGPDGRVRVLEVTRELTRQVAVLDPASGKKLLVQPLPEIAHDSPHWGEDGRTLLIPDKSGYLIWDLVAGKERGQLRAHGPFALSPNGKSLLGGADGLLQRWDLRTMKPLYAIKAARIDNRGPWLTLACSPDGKQFVSTEGDGNVCTWDLRTGRLLPVMNDLPGGDVTFTRDGKRLLVATWDGPILVCDPMSGKVLRRVKLEGLPKQPSSRGVTIYEGNNLVIIRDSDPWGNPFGFRPPDPEEMAAWDIQTGKRRWRRNLEAAETLSVISRTGAWVWTGACGYARWRAGGSSVGWGIRTSRPDW
jgi:WD40 repeat protein